MRGKTALIGFLIIEAAVLIAWLLLLAPRAGSGMPFIVGDLQIWTGPGATNQVGSFRGGTALAAAPFDPFDRLLWATLLMAGAAIVGWFAGGAFRSARTWLSSLLSIAALGMAAGTAYFIATQWLGDTAMAPGSVNAFWLYDITRAFLVQLLVAWVLFAIFTILAIAGVATAGRPLGYHLVVLNWLFAAIVWAGIYLGFYLAPTVI
jgi:hypothetical protein